MAKKKSTFGADFKKFISRGNVVDMAVGVVVGGAFSKIVTGLVNYIINPAVNIFMKKGGLDSIKTVITPEVVDETGAVTTAEVAILWGTWIQTIIDFLIVAICVFMMVRIITNVRKALEYKKLEANTGESVRILLNTDKGNLLLTDYASCGKMWTEKKSRISVWLNRR